LTATGQWPAFDPYATVLLEDEQDAASEIGAGTATARPQGGATIARFENTQVSVDVTSARAGFVIMNSAWHPWWRATVDGKEASLLKANVMFRAVPVPAGRHRVQLSFEPLEGAMTQIAQWRRSALAAHAGRGPFYP
jgi:hypothetical protein